ncbi:MAG: NupC/NupG family nucleoside CNT transporter [Candidatus Krumholzibacteriia bacterium]
MSPANLVSLLGMVVLLGLAWALSSNRRAFPVRTVVWGLILQLVFALLLLRTGWGQAAFRGLRTVVVQVLAFTDRGSEFVFGPLFRTAPDFVTNLGAGKTWWEGVDPGTGEPVAVGMVFAIHVLPIIIFFCSLMAILYHLGIMQRIIQGVAWVMRKTMKTSGAETLSVSANIFVGQTEAPIVIRPYLASLTASELMAVMVGGFATVAGSVMAAYVRFGVDAGHLLTASVLSAPAALVMAKILLPETERSETAETAQVNLEREHVNVIEAAAAGASDGVKLALNVGGMLIAFIALVAMVNYGLGWVGLSLQQIFGWLFAPLAWTMGIPWDEARTFGNLLGTKIAVNEFVAYIELMQAQSAGTLSPRSVVIGTYALCGFANFSSIAIQIGGIGALAPARRGDLARLSLKAMFGGAFASWLTACVAGLLYG